MNLRIQLEDGKHVHLTIESQDLTREIDNLFTFGIKDGNRWYPPSRIKYVDISEENTMVLTPRESEMVAEALVNPPEPNDHVKEAWARYHDQFNDGQEKSYEQHQDYV